MKSLANGKTAWWDDGFIVISNPWAAITVLRFSQVRETVMGTDRSTAWVLMDRLIALRDAEH